MAYDCFISYSHRSDAVLAPALEHGLERLARPWYRLRALHVFRDQSDLSLTPSLWGTIVGALDGARYFVLLASPESAASEWVNKEVAHWCDTKGPDGLFVVVTGGELDWDDGAKDFSASSTAVPQALRGRFASEPLYLDLRWTREVPDLTLRLSRFRAAIAVLASPMRGLPPDELEGEDIRLHRRARRLARAAVSALVVLALVASAAAVVAVANARRAEREARVALARQVGLEAIDLPASALDRAFLLALASADLEAGSDATRFRPTRTLIGRFSRLDRIRSTETPAGSTSVRSVAVAADGTLAGSALAFDSARGTASTDVLWWPPGAGSPRRVDSPIGAGDIAFVGAASDHLVVRSGDAGLLVTPDGEARTLPGVVAAVRGDVARAVTIDGGTARLVDLADGQALAEVAVDGPATTSVHRDVTVVATGTRLVVLDTRTGATVGEAGLASPVAAAEANEYGSVVVTIEQAGTTGMLRVWRRQADGSLAADEGGSVAVDLGPGAVRRAVVAPDGARLLVVTDERTVLVDTAGGVPVSVDEGGVGVVAGDASGRYVAVGGPRLAVWDLQTGQRRIALPERVSALAWGGSCALGEPCVLATVGTSLDVWDPAALTHQRMATDTNAQAVAVSPDGSTIASAGWGPAVAVWQLQSRPDTTVRRELAPAGALTAFDPESGVLARVAGGDGPALGPEHHPGRVHRGRAGRPDRPPGRGPPAAHRLARRRPALGHRLGQGGRPRPGVCRRPPGGQPRRGVDRLPAALGQPARGVRRRLGGQAGRSHPRPGRPDRTGGRRRRRRGGGDRRRRSRPLPPGRRPAPAGDQDRRRVRRGAGAGQLAGRVPRSPGRRTHADRAGRGAGPGAGVGRGRSGRADRVRRRPAGGGGGGAARRR